MPWKRGPSRVWIPGLCLLALLALLWSVQREARLSGSGVIPVAGGSEDGWGARAGATPASEDELALSSAEDDRGRTARSGSEERTVLHSTPRTRSLRVLDPAGEPIADAVVLRTELTPTWFVAWRGSRGLDWEAVRQRSSLSRTDERGHCELAEPSAAAEVAVLVAHPSFLATVLALPSEDAAEIPGSIVLQRAPAIRALVRGPGGKPVEGAIVRQRFQEELLSAARGDDLLTRARRSLELSSTTDASGAVDLFPLPGAQQVFAEHGALESAVWLGEQPAEPSLDLLETFFVRGRVGPWPPPPSGPVSVQARAFGGGSGHVYGVARVDGHGSFGPLRLPLVPAELRVLRLEASGLVTRERVIDAPGPGATLVVDFELRAGRTVAVRVSESDAQPIPRARVLAQWQEGSAWLDCLAHTDDAGRAELTLPEDATVWLRGYCSGFVPSSLGPLRIDSDLSQPLDLSLRRAGRLEVVCLLGGEPVRDYELIHWMAGAEDHELEQVRGRADGTLVLDRVPLGEVWLMAHAPGTSLSAPKSTVVREEETHRVVLELSAGFRGIGRVLDALTQRPIEGASVRLLALVGRVRVGQVGPTATTDAAGRFELAGLREGECLLHVEAPGYATDTPAVFPSAPEPVDLGVVALEPLGELEVILRPDFPLDFSTVRASLQANETWPARPFDATGSVRFEGVGPGYHHLDLLFAHATTLSDRIELPPAREWRIEIPLEGRVRFEVELIGRVDLARSGKLWLELSWLRADGRTVLERRWLGEEGRIPIETKARGAVVLALREGERILAVEQVDLAAIEGGVVRLELDAEGVELRLVDPAARPIPGATVRARTPGDATLWSHAAVTDGAGRCRLPRPAGGELRLDVTALDGARMIGVPVRLVSDAAELVFAADARLSVRVVDAGLPLAGVTLLVCGEDPFHPGFTSITSAADGRALHERLGEGRYRVRVRQAGLWPSEHVVHATSSGSGETIAVRRVGSLAIEVQRSGRALPRVRIELIHEDLGVSVVDWVREGSARASAEDLSTDDSGRLRVDGIPHGRYRWSVDPDAGGVREGWLVVPPGAVGRARIELP